MSQASINRNEVRIIGMSRSGNHAVIQWLVAQMPGRVCWLNCCEPRYNPFWVARPFDNGEPYWVNYEPFNLEWEKGRHFSRKDWLLFNHEDTFLRVACSPEHEREHDAWVGPSERRSDVLILRDPFNLFASRLRSLEPEVSGKIAMKIWKQHAKQALGRVRMLRHDPLVILYNRWCLDADYRASVCEHLGIPFTDAGKESVAAVHGGSSFDGLRYDGKASAMRVMDRWRGYVRDPEYLSLFDEETVDLAEAVFGESRASAAVREALAEDDAAVR